MQDIQGIIIHLLSLVDQTNADYINGTIDNTIWSKTLEDIDHKLEVIGLRLVYRPWEGHSVTPISAGNRI